MNLSDNIIIRPGYAVIYRHDTDAITSVAEMRFQDAGLSVEIVTPPCDNLDGVMALRRINLPNLSENAYAYACRGDFEGFSPDDTAASISEFISIALDVTNPLKGHYRYTPERQHLSRFPKQLQNACMSMPSCCCDDDENSECDNSASSDISTRDDDVALLISDKSSEDILNIIGRLIKTYALKEHTIAPIDRLLEVARSKIVIASTSPSPVKVSKRLEITFPGFDGMKLMLSPKMRVVYSLFLRHPRGIFMNSLDDYLQEVKDLIDKVAPKGKYGLGDYTANRLCMPKSEDMNQMISKINRIISNQIHPASGLDGLYRISGNKGDVYKIEIASQTIFE